MERNPSFVCRLVAGPKSGRGQVEFGANITRHCEALSRMLELDEIVQEENGIEFGMY